QPAGRRARANDPNTWSSFELVLAAYQQGQFDGVGFCLGDGWAGVDLDDCVYGPDYDYNGDARAMLKDLLCYVEMSPSGTGVKAIGRSARVGGEVKFDKVDAPAFTPWQGARFFTITGQGGYKLQGDPLADITSFVEKWFAPRRVRAADRPAYVRDGDLRGTEHVETMTESEVIVRILASPQADKFMRLCRGDMSDYANDHSRADQGFFSLVLYWSRDIDVAEAMLKQTKLYTEARWNRPSY